MGNDRLIPPAIRPGLREAFSERSGPPRLFPDRFASFSNDDIFRANTVESGGEPGEIHVGRGSRQVQRIIIFIIHSSASSWDLKR